eukprot:CAMPEP_0113938870 /NCGR_PEP_ID=MMETSP1339-20121228/5284_1 /TAXON_ID=94617 /ORGANISM="Fibrocapsa japonica" /LENGTH=333 /DNA_ID=CAMNT_0000942183 /DNA_START=254 /DNA_END=1255 /DNA_ORIENTATION=+ /assembly_acc=CAM_ASM_000762
MVPTALTPTLQPTASPTPAPSLPQTSTPTISPTLTPTPSPTLRPSSGCSQPDQHLFYRGSGEKLCIRCVSRDAVIYEDQGPRCLENAQGEKCLNMAWEHGQAVCTDSCPSQRAVVYDEQGWVHCLRNNRGEACQTIVWHDAQARCMDPCGASSVVWDQAEPRCLLDDRGEACSSVGWSVEERRAVCVEQEEEAGPSSSSLRAFAARDVQCKNVAWSGLDEVCFDQCPGGLSSVVHQGGSPKCLTNDQGGGCVKVVWSGSTPTCLDRCPSGSGVVFQGEDQGSTCAVNQTGGTCNVIVWNGHKALCGDGCVAVEYSSGSPPSCVWEDGTKNPMS